MIQGKVLGEGREVNGRFNVIFCIYSSLINFIGNFYIEERLGGMSKEDIQDEKGEGNRGIEEKKDNQSKGKNKNFLCLRPKILIFGRIL